MKRSESAMARHVDDELVLLDVPSGRFFALNDVGSVVWDRLQDECSHDELVDAVVADFDVDRGVASRDVADLIAQLVDAGLVST